MLGVCVDVLTDVAIAFGLINKSPKANVAIAKC